LILLAGFPDTARSWERLAPRFASTHHVASLAMPGYEDDSLPAGRRWGYRILDDVLPALDDLVRSYRKVGCRTVHLAGHDWGSVVALLYAARYRDSSRSSARRIDKLVMLDVGGFDLWQLSPKQAAVLLCYQSFFAAVFVLSRLLPREGWALPLLAAFPYRLLGPCPHEVCACVELSRCRSSPIKGSDLTRPFYASLARWTFPSPAET
jgi:pimeloyl-ACP methyl ester carboxylesterase